MPSENLLDALDFRGTERFDVTRRIGEGGMGVVYEAYDRKRKTTVALKTLNHVSPGAIYRIKKEFRALADVVHPNLITLYELVSHGEHWFFTMELVEGTKFLEYVRPGLVSEALTQRFSLSTGAAGDLETKTLEDITLGERRDTEALLNDVAIGRLDPAALPALDHDRVRHALGELAQGLNALHAAGKLHRDIKPSNVMVSPKGRVVLLDFGLARDIDEDSLAQSAVGGVVGTVAYMAPEQASGGTTSSASDWYSVGVMLYQTLTGQLPFRGSLYQVIFRKQDEDPVDVLEVAPNTPFDLAALAMHLLSRDPEARPTGQRVLERLGRSDSDNTSGSFSVRSIRESGSGLVGRQRELATLWAAFERLDNKRPVVALVRGNSGMGKTTLLLEFFQRVKGRATVFSGRCFERELVPYNALDSLIDALSRHLKKWNASQARALLPPGVGALARLFPALERVDAIKDAAVMARRISDPSELRARAFAAFRALMQKLSRRERVIICIDDLQWGDVDSADALAELLRPPAAPPVLLLAAYRSEDASSSELVQRLKAAAKQAESEIVELEVGPLDEEAGAQLAQQTLKDAMAEAADGTLGLFSIDGAREPALPATDIAHRIAREARGNPFFIRELAARAVERAGASAQDVERVHSQPISLIDVLQRRVATLPDAPRRLLEVICVSGRPVSADVAFGAAQLSRGDPVALATLKSQGLVRVQRTNEGDELETFHDRVREAVLRTLKPGDLRNRHRGLAVALEETPNVDPERLFYHLASAGQKDRASEHAEEAARRSFDSLAFYQAAALYGMALDLSTDSDDRWDLHESWARALARAGRGEEAAEAFIKAARRAPENRASDLRRQAAEQLLRAGQTGTGLRALAAVLRHFNLSLPRDAEESLEMLRVARSRVLLRGLSFRERDAREIPPAVLERVDTFWSAAVGLIMIDLIQAAIFVTGFLHAALDAGERHRIARALAMEVWLLSAQGKASPNRQRRVIEALHTLASRAEDPYVPAIAAYGEGHAALHEGRWKDAAEKCREAEIILRQRCNGVDWEIDSLIGARMSADVNRAAIDGLHSRLENALEDARSRGNLYGQTLLRTAPACNFIWLLQDDEPRARMQLMRAVEASKQAGFHLQHFWELCSRVQLDLYSGDGERAWTRISRHWALLEESRFLRTQMLRLDAHFLRARAALMAADTHPESPRLIRAAQEDAKTLERVPLPFAAAISKLMQACVHVRLRPNDEGVAVITDAASALNRAGMPLLELAAHRKAAELKRDDRLRDNIDQRLRDMTVANPARLMRMLAP